MFICTISSGRSSQPISTQEYWSDKGALLSHVGMEGNAFIITYKLQPWTSSFYMYLQFKIAPLIRSLRPDTAEKKIIPVFPSACLKTGRNIRWFNLVVIVTVRQWIITYWSTFRGNTLIFGLIWHTLVMPIFTYFEYTPYIYIFKIEFTCKFGLTLNPLLPGKP